MPSEHRTCSLTTEKKRRVLAAFHDPDDWQAVAKRNGLSRGTVWRVVNLNRAENLQLGDARAARTKVMPAIVMALEEYAEENCCYTLAQMKEMLTFDFVIDISTSTISRHLLGKLYIVKQTRIEPASCNSETNKLKRKEFADALIAHERAGNYIVFMDETNFNLYCKRSQGRARLASRVVVMLLPSKGANLQIQCAVSLADGVLLHQLERGSIKMQQTADFLEAVYAAAKELPSHRELYEGKRVVMVLDNTPAHQQAEVRVPEHDDMVLLRLVPYSSMCKPIEGCFSALKARIKAHLALNNGQMMQQGDYPTMTARRMALLEAAAVDSMSYITARLVCVQHSHALRAVEAARRMEDMQYGK